MLFPLNDYDYKYRTLYLLEDEDQQEMEMRTVDIYSDLPCCFSMFVA